MRVQKRNPHLSTLQYANYIQTEAISHLAMPRTKAKMTKAVGEEKNVKQRGVMNKKSKNNPVGRKKVVIVKKPTAK
jgi:predicted GIY-YIG superfamily endonuclease